MLILLFYFLSSLCVNNTTNPQNKTQLKEPSHNGSQEQYLFDKIQRMVDEFDSLKGSLLKAQYSNVVDSVTNKNQSK